MGTVKLGVLTDDLTGAVDTGAQFAKGGLHTTLMLSPAKPLPAEVAVLSTDSRGETPAEACLRTM